MQVVGRLMGGWVVVTMTYFIALWLLLSLYPLLFQQPTDYNEALSGTFIGIPLLVVPYWVAGMYARKEFANRKLGALFVSLIPVVGERALIYLTGYLFVLGGGDGDGSMNGQTASFREVMMFIRGEAAPYFSSLYIYAGIISVLVCLYSAMRERGGEPVPGHECRDRA